MRLGWAVVSGVMAAQLASCVLFGPAIAQLLTGHAQHNASPPAATLVARAALDQARADRAAQGRSVRNTRHDLDQALLVARCETQPGPECPLTKITGIPGRGPAALMAEAALATTGERLAAAQDRAALLDDRIDQWQNTLDHDHSQAAPTHSLLASWRALNEYTAGHPATLLMPVVLELGTVALAVLPVLVAQRRRRYGLPPGTEAGSMLSQRLRLEPIGPAPDAADTAHSVKPAPAPLPKPVPAPLRRRRVLAIGNVDIGVVGRAPVNPPPHRTSDTNGSPGHQLHAMLARLPLGGLVTRLDDLVHDAVKVVETLRHTRRVTVDLATDTAGQ